MCDFIPAKIDHSNMGPQGAPEASNLDSRVMDFLKSENQEEALFYANRYINETYPELRGKVNVGGCGFTTTAEPWHLRESGFGNFYGTPDGYITHKNFYFELDNGQTWSIDPCAFLEFVDKRKSRGTPSHGISDAELKGKVYKLFDFNIDNPHIEITELKFNWDPPFTATGWQYGALGPANLYAEIKYTFKGAPCSDRKIIPDGWIRWESK